MCDTGQFPARFTYFVFEQVLLVPHLFVLVACREMGGEGSHRGIFIFNIIVLGYAGVRHRVYPCQDYLLEQVILVPRLFCFGCVQRDGRWQLHPLGTMED